MNNARAIPAMTPANGLPPTAAVSREPELPVPAAITVDPAKAELFSQLARRVVLLNKILASLQQSRDAIVGLNLDGIYASVTEQQSLCNELRTLQNALPRRPGGAITFTSAELERVAALRREMNEAEGNLRRQARVNSSLLRRCGRTNATLRSLYQSCLGTYAEPGAAEPANLTKQR